MRKINFLVLLIGFCATSYGQSGTDMRVLSEDSRSLVVEFVPVFTNAAVSGNDGVEYTRFNFQGAVTVYGEQGSPMLPFRAGLVNLPSDKYIIQVLAVDYHDVTGVRPATRPQFIKDKEFGVVPRYTAPDEKFKTMDFLPKDVVELSDVGESRGFTLGTLKFYPVQVALGRNAVRVYTRIVVRIEFLGAASPDFSASMFLKNQLPSFSSERSLAKSSKVVSDSPLAQGEWYRMEVKENGIYKIDQAFFAAANIPLSAIGNINSIRIFGNGGEELPEDLTAARPDGIDEIPRLVVDRNGNGVFDSDDFVLFYGKSTRGWKYDPSAKTYFHYINHYTETNYYFLTYGGAGRGKNMATISSTNLPGVYNPTDFQGKVFVEEEAENLVNSGRQWIGRKFDDVTTSAVYTTLLPGVDATKTMTYRFTFLSQSTSIDTFRVQENNQPFGFLALTYPIDVNSIENEKAYQTGVMTYDRFGAIPNDRSILRVLFGRGSSSAKGWVDWFEILYRQRFEAVNDFLLFSSPDTTATIEYNLKNLSSRTDVYAFDVAQHNNVKQITNLVFDPANTSIVKFQVPQVAGSVREFAVVGPNGYKTPTNAKRLTNSNLHGIADGADFIIIAPSDFLSEAERLKAHREKNDQLKTVVVNTEQIFNEFSCGMIDPMAIRDFLKYAQTNWTIRPKYVLLFGAGNFDYKNIKSSMKNWVLPYESLNSIHQILTLASDDFFVFLTPNVDRISLPIGRLPVHSTKEAKDVVDKIIAYETAMPFDPWRNRITFVADDGLTNSGDDGIIHTDQAEQIARDYTPASFERDKIYIVEYPTVITSTGRRKPTANQAIIDAINRGTLILNYTGHGNPDQWAHEKIFSKDESFSQIRNTGKPFLVVAATCDYARYDYPFEVSAGEVLLAMPQTGAIGVVTAARVVYSYDNFQLNAALYSYFFPKNTQGQVVRLGDAMWATKQIYNRLNDQKHHLLADPTMRLAMPRATATVDSINGQSTARLITVPSLGRVAANGALKKNNGTIWDTFNGRALLEVFDAKRKVFVPEWGNDYYFEVDGSLIYRGEVSVKNGLFKSTFPVPKDVSYGDSRSRIAVYAYSDSTDASGYTESITIFGNANAGVDTVGPKISIHLDDPSFRAGDVVKPNAMLVVDLTDSSGINTSTAGIGHRLEALMDNSRSFDLTDFYRGKLDTYQSGQVRYPLTSLPEGRHTLSVKAWDTYNNPAFADTYFEVRDSSVFSIHNVFNFPNPFNRTTTFTFQRTSIDPIDVEIKVYTIAGRLIQSLSTPSIIDRFVQVPWDGRDRDGNEIANGVYFYKVIAKSLDRSSTSEVLGKLTVLR
ncbi:MAG: type IX secretion system sortase PorU [Ignavibacteriales bacterium]|nr:type IX secretion system sortase PorU [Ignavibacteriales bacterium]